MLQELLPLRLKVTGHVFLSAVNLSEHLITGRTAAEWKRLSPSLSFFSSPPVTAATSSEPRRSAGQLSEVVICVFIWRPAELARLQSGDKLDPRPAKASSETKSIDPVTVRGRLSRHLGRNYSRGLALSRSLSLSLHSGKADRKAGALCWSCRWGASFEDEWWRIVLQPVDKSWNLRRLHLISFCPRFTSFVHFTALCFILPVCWIFIFTFSSSLFILSCPILSFLAFFLSRIKS